MPIITGEIVRDGAIIDVLIGVSGNRQSRLLSVGFRVPATIPVRAVIDTGSHLTGLMPSVFRALEIQPFRYLPIRTPSTKPDSPHWCDQYDVSLTLVSGEVLKYLPSVHAIASEDFDEEEGVQALIGRDVLDLCVFSYYGPHQKFSLAF